MFKGYKLTKRLQRYMEYAKNKYIGLSKKGDVDLWNILSEYEFIMQQPKCMQMFIYDMICDEFVHYGEYAVIRAIDGGIYVRKMSKCRS